MNYISLLNLSYFSHQFILLLCFYILMFVMIIFFFMYKDVSFNTFFFTHFLLEYFWTLLPMFLVLLLFIPLFFFTTDKDNNTFLCYFFVGNQWFWDYYSNYNFFVPLDVNILTGSSFYLPALMSLNFFFTSNDVLHAFSLPMLYTMMDLVPGTMHNLNLFFPFSGYYTVYCAQICGLNHSNMPIWILAF